MKILRASSAFVYENCDVAWELMEQAGEEPATIFAFKGTRIHRVLAASQDVTPSDLDPDESRIFEDLFAGFGRQVAIWREGAEIDRSWIEQEFTWRLGPDLQYVGHPDRVLKCGDRLFIPDFKTSWHPLDAISATNAQLRAYVAIVDATIEEDIAEIMVWIDKPGKKDPPAYYDRQSIQEAKLYLRNRAVRITSPGQKTPTRGPWCTYCSGKVICPLWQREIEKLATNVEPIENMPDRQLALIAPKLAIAKKVVERLQARLEERVRANPEFFADWRFKEGRKSPHIESVSKAWAAMQQEIDAETFLELTKLTIGKLVDKYRELKKCTWEEARQKVEKQLGANLQYKQAKPELVYQPQTSAIDVWASTQEHSQITS